MQIKIKNRKLFFFTALIKNISLWPVRLNSLLFSVIIILATLYSTALYAQKGHFSNTIVPDSTDTFFLEHKHIDPSTFFLVSDGKDTLESGKDFQLDPNNGRLKLLIQTTRYDSLFYSFLYLPVNVIDTLQNREFLSPSFVDSLMKNEQKRLVYTSGKKRNDSYNFSDLQRSGNIMRGVQVGSGRDVGLESGLHLSLNGRIARNIRVKALLDDRNLPLQPEGSSSRLSEIDQVYIDISSGRTSGRFGDYHLVQKVGYYGNIDRRLEGGKVNYKSPEKEFEMAGAVTRAVFHTNNFNGIDGVQGPYRLTGKENEQNFIILGGSEKIWLEGKKLKRGQAFDYVIDYNRGEITFTPRKQISSESRIVVDFEYVPDAYPRNLYTGSFSLRSPENRYKLDFSIFQEGDDYERPINFKLNDQYKEI